MYASASGVIKFKVDDSSRKEAATTKITRDPIITFQPGVGEDSFLSYFFKVVAIIEAMDRLKTVNGSQLINTGSF